MIYLTVGALLALLCAYSIHVEKRPVPKELDSTFSLMMLYGTVITAWPFLIGYIIESHKK